MRKVIFILFIYLFKFMITFILLCEIILKEYLFLTKRFYFKLFCLVKQF